MKKFLLALGIGFICLFILNSEFKDLSPALFIEGNAGSVACDDGIFSSQRSVLQIGRCKLSVCLSVSTLV